MYNTNTGTHTNPKATTQPPSRLPNNFPRQNPGSGSNRNFASAESQPPRANPHSSGQSAEKKLFSRTEERSLFTLHVTINKNILGATSLEELETIADSDLDNFDAVNYTTIISVINDRFIKDRFLKPEEKSRCIKLLSTITNKISKLDSLDNAELRNIATITSKLAQLHKQRYCEKDDCVKVSTTCIKSFDTMISKGLEKRNASPQHISLFANALSSISYFNNTLAYKMIHYFNLNEANEQSVSLFANALSSIGCLDKFLANQMILHFDPSKTNEQNIALFANALSSIGCLDKALANQMALHFDPSKTNEQNISLFANALSSIGCLDKALANRMTLHFDPSKTNEQNISLFAKVLSCIGCLDKSLANQMILHFDPSKANEQNIALFANALSSIGCLNKTLAAKMILHFDPNKANEQNIALFANALSSIGCLDKALAAKMILHFDPSKANEQSISLFANALVNANHHDENFERTLLERLETSIEQGVQGLSPITYSLIVKILAVNDVAPSKAENLIKILKAQEKNNFSQYLNLTLTGYINFYHFVEFYHLKYERNDPGLIAFGKFCKSKIDDMQLSTKTFCRDSKLQKDVYRYLKKIYNSEILQEEVPLEGFFIDVVLSNPYCLIEIDGPIHFNPDKTYDKKTVFKHYLLKSKYSLCSIKYDEWDALNTDEEKINFLKQKITEAISEHKMAKAVERQKPTFQAIPAEEPAQQTDSPIVLPQNNNSTVVDTTFENSKDPIGEEVIPRSGDATKAHKKRKKKKSPNSSISSTKVSIHDTPTPPPAHTFSSLGYLLNPHGAAIFLAVIITLTIAYFNFNTRTE